jgi:hypothetical protein
LVNFAILIRPFGFLVWLIFEAKSNQRRKPKGLIRIANNNQIRKPKGLIRIAKINQTGKPKGLIRIAKLIKQENQRV